MKYRKLDDNGDYILGRRNHFHTGSAAVAQAIRTRLLMFLGEWWEHIDQGTPWREEIMATFHGAETPGIDLILSERIAGTEGVTEISSFDSNFNLATRTYTASCVVLTEFGDTVSVEISPSSSKTAFFTVKAHVKGVAA